MELAEAERLRGAAQQNVEDLTAKVNQLQTALAQQTHAVRESNDLIQRLRYELASLKKKEAGRVEARGRPRRPGIGAVWSPRGARQVLAP